MHCIRWALAIESLPFALLLIASHEYTSSMRLPKTLFSIFTQDPLLACNSRSIARRVRLCSGSSFLSLWPLSPRACLFRVEVQRKNERMNFEDEEEDRGASSASDKEEKLRLGVDWHFSLKLIIVCDI